MKIYNDTGVAWTTKIFDDEGNDITSMLQVSSLFISIVPGKPVSCIMKCSMTETDIHIINDKLKLVSNKEEI